MSSTFDVHPAARTTPAARLLTGLALVAALAPATAQAREGFVIGGGLGVGLVSIEGEGAAGAVESSAFGSAIDIDIGWAFDDHWMLHLADRQLWFQLDGEWTMSENVGLGVTWFSAPDAGWLASASVGLGLVVQPGTDLEIQRGLGVNVGIGYALDRRWVAQLDAGWNNPGDFTSATALLRVKYLYN